SLLSFKPEKQNDDKQNIELENIFYNVSLKNPNITKIAHNGNIVTQIEEIKETIKEACKEMYKKIDIDKTVIGDYLKTLKLQQVEQINNNITEEEILKAINYLNDGRSPGPDGLPAELYKKCKHQLVKTLKYAYDEGIKNGKMHESFYQGILTLILKRGPEENINNYRHITLMNMDYKVFAKIIANKIEEHLGMIVDNKQSCAIKGRYMWDNLNTLREIIWSKQESNFYLIALDQKKPSILYHGNIYGVSSKKGFCEHFINLVKCLYVKSTVKVNVNGQLTEQFEISRGVKQGCPLSAALYILAISPLIKCIKDDPRIQGVQINGNKYVISAYADDITVLVKSNKDLEYKHFKNYEKVSGAELNKDKCECIWIGDTGSKSKFSIDIQEQKQIKILGIYFDNNQCVDFNCSKKEEETDKEIEKYSKIKLNYKTKINIINTFILPKTLFSASVFPPTQKWAVRINQKTCTFI
uniref:Reverse transcriptase domain-containing protein n=1 Tax=Astyanax mexicanus TaxID=7994 RepID=A0A3B1IMU6_ASTMX